MATNNKTHSKPNYVPHIDGLRGISVLIILLFHLDFPYISGGFVGVDIFFVISGFLITGIIVREVKAGTFSFLNFYARRIKRIFPALFVMLFFSALFALLFLGMEEFNAHFKAIRMASAQASNFFFAGEVDYFATGFDSAPLLHTWSLGIEEQFYLIWPLLLIAAHKLLGAARGNLILIAIFIASLITSEYLVRTDAMSAFYHLHSRAWELAIGGIIAIGCIPKLNKQLYIEVASILGLSLILASALFIEKGNFPGLNAIAPCLGAALIIYSAQQKTGNVHAILSNKVLIFCGLISYSLYLWHWPIIAFYKSYFGADLSLQVQLSIAISSFVIAYLSYRYIEQPFRTSKQQPLKVILIGALVIIISIVFSNILKNQDKADWRVSYKLEESVVSAHNLDKICSAEGGAYDKENCIIGANKDSYEVILVGDSFASHYTPTILQWAKKRDLTVRLFMRGACRTWIENEGTRIKTGKVDQYCMDLTPAFYDTLENDKSIKYVFLGLKAPGLNDNIRSSLEKIASYDKRTYFLGTGPLFKENPHECQIKNNLIISKILPLKNAENNCMNIDIEYTNKKLATTNNAFIPLLKNLGIPYFDPLPIMQPPYDKNNNFMFMDDGHMNKHGALHLVPYLDNFTNSNDNNIGR